MITSGGQYRRAARSLINDYVSDVAGYGVGGHLVNAEGHACSRVVSARDLRPRYRRVGRDQYEAKVVAYTERVALRHRAGGSIDPPAYQLI